MTQATLRSQIYFTDGSNLKVQEALTVINALRCRLWLDGPAYPAGGWDGQWVTTQDSVLAWVNIRNITKIMSLV